MNEPDRESPDHRFEGVSFEESSPPRFVGHCTCGWASSAVSTAGLAGTLVDAHIEAHIEEARGATE